MAAVAPNECSAEVDQMLNTFGVMSSALLSSNAEDLEVGLSNLCKQAAETCPTLITSTSDVAERDLKDDAGFLTLKNLETAGTMVNGSAAHWRWSQALKEPAFRNAYNALGKSHKATRLFKQKWAAREIAVLKEEKREFQEHAEADAVGGTYQTIAQIINAQGRDKAGAIAVRNLVLEALQRAAAGIPSHTNQPMTPNLY